MREFNRQLSAIRAAVERCIGHLKNWKILATGYRGRITELPTLIQLIVRLERLRTTWQNHLRITLDGVNPHSRGP
ncbi:transposase family protein [Actinokineospora fastidiosa]|uniref:transposase family protein n=1 Tax=Actinokineospora fastidiosa TaxID=1816 RepID=UPI003571347E